MSSRESEPNPGVRDAVKHQLPLMAFVLSVVFVMGAILVVIYYTTDINVRIIISDPAETALLPEYAGWYSHAGVLVLWTGAVIAFVSGRFGTFPDSARRRFVISFALIIGFLALDDLFMFHEWFGLKLAQWSDADDIGQARSALEGIVFAVYVLVGGTWLVLNRRRVWRSPWPMFALGVIGFAASVVLDLAPYLVDALNNVSMRVETTLAVVEELLKLVGIGAFTAYALLISLPHLRAIEPVGEATATTVEDR